VPPESLIPTRCTWCRRIRVGLTWRRAIPLRPTTDTICPDCQTRQLAGDHPTPERVDDVLRMLAGQPAADPLLEAIRAEQKVRALERSIRRRMLWRRVKRSWWFRAGIVLAAVGIGWALLAAADRMGLL
jgi:hypothetical protein